MSREINHDFAAAVERIKELEEQIRELAVQVAADYPDIENVPTWECFWAIRSSYEGICLANADMHKLCGHLQKQLGIDVHEVIRQWDEIRKQP
jgi:hypothetical protein